MNAISHTVYTLERCDTGAIITACRDRGEAREIAETLADFDPEQEPFALVPHTLH